MNKVILQLNDQIKQINVKIIDTKSKPEISSQKDNFTNVDNNSN